MTILEQNLGTASDNEFNVVFEERSYKVCRDWAGEESTNQLCDAFTRLQEANSDRDFGGRLTSRYWGTSVRHITRPLMFAPHRLLPEDEEYFLPHIFNVSDKEARLDYTEIHGTSRTASRDAVMDYVSRVEGVIESIEEISEAAPKNEFLENMITALKMYNSILRSSGNFAEGQVRTVLAWIKYDNTDRIALELIELDENKE